MDKSRGTKGPSTPPSGPHLATSREGRRQELEASRVDPGAKSAGWGREGEFSEASAGWFPQLRQGLPVLLAFISTAGC